MRISQWIPCGFLLLALGASLGAQPQSLFEAVDAQAFPRIQTSLRLALATRQTELKSEDFRLEEDGVPIQDFQLEIDPRPVYLSLVLDRSGSMRGRFAHLKLAATRFLDGLDPRFRVRLSSFSDQVLAEDAFGLEARLLKKQIGGLKAEGATRLYDAIAEALSSLDSVRGEARRVVVVFTDGRDSKRPADGPGRLSKADPKALVRSARQRGVPVYFLGLGQDVHRKLLTKIAQATGGQAAFASQKEGLEALFLALAKRLEVTARIRYTTPKPQADGTIRVLRVRTKSQGTRGQGEARYKAPQRAPRLSPEETFASIQKAIQGLGAYRVGLRSTTWLPPHPVRIRPPLVTTATLAKSPGPQGYEDVRLNWGLEGAQGEVQMLRAGGKVQLKLGVPGQVAWTVGGDASLVKADPVASVVSWLDPKVAQKPSQARFEARGETRLAQLDPQGEPTGLVFTFDPKTRLPQTVLNLDPTSGARSVVELGPWEKISVAPPELPSFEGKADPAELGLALALVERSLALAGQASQLGLRAAQETFAVALPWSLAVTEKALDEAGGLIRVLHSSKFAKVRQGEDSAGLLKGFEADPSRALDGWLTPEIEAFTKAQESFTQDLDQSLRLDLEGYHKGLEITRTTLQELQTNFETELFPALNSMIRDGQEIEKAGLDLARQGLELGQKAEELGTDLGTLGEDLGQMGEDLGQMGEDLGETGEALGDFGANLGKQMRGLKGLEKLKGLQGLGGSWQDDD